MSGSVIASLDVRIPLAPIFLLIVLRTKGWCSPSGGDIYWVNHLCEVGLVNVDWTNGGTTGVTYRTIQKLEWEQRQNDEKQG